MHSNNFISLRKRIPKGCYSKFYSGYFIMKTWGQRIYKILSSYNNVNSSIKLPYDRFLLVIDDVLNIYILLQNSRIFLNMFLLNLENNITWCYLNWKWGKPDVKRNCVTLLALPCWHFWWHYCLKYQDPQRSMWSLVHCNWSVCALIKPQNWNV